MTKACMGGWCLKRLQCPNYTEADRSDQEPAERLCERGRDGVLADATAANIRPTDRDNRLAVAGPVG